MRAGVKGDRRAACVRRGEREWRPRSEGGRTAAACRARRRLLGAAGALSGMTTALWVHAAAVGAQVTVTPDSSQGPGGAQLQQLVNWGAGMALIVCVAAIVFHALRWGWGSQQHNLARVQDGKEGVGRAALVAGIIAAAAALINFAVNLGGAVK